VPEVIDAVRELMDRPWDRAHVSWLDPSLLPPGWSGLARSEVSARLLARLWATHLQLPVPDPFRLTGAAGRLSLLPACGLEPRVLERAADALGRLSLASEASFATQWLRLGRDRERLGTAAEWREAIQLARARPLRLPDGVLVDGGWGPALARSRGAAFMRLALDDGQGGLWPWLKFRFDREILAPSEREPGRVDDDACSRIPEVVKRRVLDVWIGVALRFGIENQFKPAFGLAEACDG